MTLPAGVLLSPFSDLSRPAALNFGHLGTYIGHEVILINTEKKITPDPCAFNYIQLLHSLDDTGRLFNSVSEISAWWPDNTTEAYNANADCFVRQYQASGVDGKRTLSENLADNGGLAAAFQGYQRWMERKKKQGLEEAQVLPGLPFSGEQVGKDREGTLLIQRHIFSNY